MAKKLALEVLPGLIAPETYWVVGVVELRNFHQTARIEMWGYLNENARHQNVPGCEGPIKTISVHVPFDHFMNYLSAQQLDGAGSNPIEAAYRMMTEVAEPHGLKEFFADAENV